MSRKLASIRKISAIKPIPNADAIEVAVIDGWNVVMKKGEISSLEHVDVTDVLNIQKFDDNFE